jgi:hypothetical protein
MSLKIVYKIEIKMMIKSDNKNENTKLEQKIISGPKFATIPVVLGAHF